MQFIGNPHHQVQNTKATPSWMIEQKASEVANSTKIIKKCETESSKETPYDIRKEQNYIFNKERRS